MARATNPGAPQRVSAHVVPKAPSFSNDDEEEKTTIESGGWEEEASTTVEQGEVAERLRALALGAAQPARSNTAITSTTGSGVSDEPTVDDQRASAALALLPPPSVARLVITQGNDAGRQLEVRPGKTYTVGRGVDNDLVLTDITASRKHFELRHETGSWIVADRASGNGTLVNSRIEDAPFMLASGDTIEVGNTAFRFELVTTAISLPGVPREAVAGSARDARATAAPSVDDPLDSRELMPTPAVHTPPVAREVAGASSAAGAERARVFDRVPDEMPSFDGSLDDDLEPSTMSGKAMQDDDPAKSVTATSRPKTLPPPAPLPRPRTQTGRPPMAFVATRSQQMAAVQPTQPPLPPVALAAMAPTLSPMHAVPALPQPATTLPLPQMANRPPLAPGLLDSSLGSPLPQLAQPNSVPTLPGQGPPVQPNRGPRLPFSYPSAPELMPQRPSYPSAPELMPQRPSGILRAQVNVAAAHPARDATSTAQVSPMSYSGAGQVVAAAAPVQRRVPVLSRRMLIALGLLGLAVFAAVATIAIIRSAGGPSHAPSRGSAGVAPVPSAQPSQPSAQPPLQPPVRPPSRPLSTPPPAPTPPTVTPIPSTPSADRSAPSAPPTPAAAPATSDRIAASAPPTAPPTVAPLPQTPAGSASAPGPSTASATPPTAPAPTSPSAPVASRAGAPSPSAAGAPAATTPSSPPPGPVASEPAHGGEPARDRPRTDPPSDRPRADPSTARTTRPAKHPEPRKLDHKVEVAVAPPARPRPRGRSLQDVKSEATGLYRSKNFSGAAQAINSALSGFSGDDVKDLKSIAGIYSQLGKAYAVGMAPGTRPIEAYQNLLRALDYDGEVGKAYAQEIRDRLAALAPRAATSFMASKSFEQAFQAVRKAEEFGSRSDDLKIVRQALEDKAKELLRAARSELAADPEAARQKLRQIQGMVERQNTIWQQASKLLTGP